jgi:hypothetical protein
MVRQVDVTVTVTVIVAVAMIVVVTIGLHLYLRVVGWGKERGLYAPSSCVRESWSWIFLQVGA